MLEDAKALHFIILTAEICNLCTATHLCEAEGQYLCRGG
jgi:hypothetical protein